jgi:creatinine amidohydrolase
VRLGACTWPELDRDAPSALVIPLGATEQHGPHLPLETDTLIACAIAEAAAAGRPDIVIAPALPYGSSDEHRGFPGTLSLGRDALEAAVIALVRSTEHFAAVVLLSWHGGNVDPLARAVSRLREEGRRVACWQPSHECGDAHAGRVETALMLAIAPELVGEERPVGATEPLGLLLPRLREHGIKAVSLSGVLGDARGATAQKGRDLLRDLVAEFTAFVDGARSTRAPA